MPALTEDFIDDVIGDLVANKVVSRRLPSGGRLYLDGQRPFLCVYRRPVGHDDPGTDSLLLSQSSFLIASADPAEADGLQRLLVRLLKTLSSAFGQVLLLELWSMRQDGEASRHIVPLAMHLVSAEARAPIETLESLERGLLRADWDGAAPVLDVDYAAMPSPPGLEPLITFEQARGAGCIALGLGISPHYRAPDTGRVLPVVLRAVRRDLGQVLKQGFFAFSHARATYRPAHYHELGPTAFTPEVRDVDQQLAEIGDRFDLLLHVTPVNADAAWRAFAAAGYDQRPQFLYRPLPVDPSSLKAALYSIPVDRLDDPALHQLFAEKRDELDRQLTLLGDRETPRFLYGSLQLFAAPDQPLLTLAKDILSREADDASLKPTNGLGADAIAARARSEIEHYRGMDASLAADVEVRDDIAGILVSQGNFLISRHASVEEDRLETTLHHEIGTHVLTHHNGLQQPFQQLHLGMAGYEELQEGVAVFAEYLAGGLFWSRLRLLAGRVMAVDALVRGAGFIDTFNLLNRDYGFGRKSAYNIAMRVHRGGGYTKDVIYLRGLANVLAYLRKGGAFERLLLGKISFDHLDLIDELVWRNVLESPRLMPRYLNQPGAQQRLDRARKTDSIFALVGE